ncbi:MAG: hypothetical protein GY801_43520 [bacterium]|nr:hypothetical protein [bacterium]
MKDRNEIIAIVIFFLSTVGTFAVMLGADQIIMSSYDYELIAVSGHWSINEMRVSEGKEVKVMLRNTDVVSHGFAIPDFDVYIEELKAGTVTEFTFTPDKKGTFPFLCTVWCSDRHMRMRGEVIVE